MRKTIVVIFLILIFLSLNLINVNAEEIGILKIQVYVTNNRPEDFKEYDFILEIMNLETNEYVEFNIFAKNDYFGEIKLPYGKYLITCAGVANDVRSKFDLNTGDSFTLSSTSNICEQILTFKNFNILKNEKITTQNNYELKINDNPLIKYKILFYILSIILIGILIYKILF